MGDHNENPLVKITDQAIRKSEFNEKFILATLHHLNIVKDHLCKKENKSQFRVRQDLIDVLLSRLFLSSPDLFPTKRYTSQVDENFEWPVSPLYPAEAFGGKEKFPEIRVKDFFKCLKVGHVLDCRVIFVLDTEYCLRVMYKYGSIRLLDDLEISVTLPRTQSETKFLQNDLEVSELIRVGVVIIEKNAAVKVTLDESALPVTKNVKLGRLSEASLPQFVLNPNAVSDSTTLTDYLNGHPRFQNQLLLNSVLKAYGYDVKKISSYYSSFNNIECSDELTGQALLKAARYNDLNTYLNTAMDEFKERNIPKALDSIQSALEIDDKCARIYEIRGEIYADLNKPKLCKKALYDFGKAFNLDNNSPIARKELAKAHSKAAIKFYKKGNYEKAVVAAQKAISFNKDFSASKLLNYLKSKPSFHFALTIFTALKLSSQAKLYQEHGKHLEAFTYLHEEEQNMRNGFPSDLLVTVKTEPVES